MVLCTVPLGVLKSGSIVFDPELPEHKLGAVQRLGFGLLNKVAMVFRHIFWDEDIDTFGCLNKESSKRGEYFLFYSYHTVSGGAVLIALVAGEAALEFEKVDPVVALHRVLAILRGKL
jgi:lysine-specific histone demethylase 1